MISRTKHLVLSAIKTSIMSELTTKANLAMCKANKAKEEGDDLERRMFRRDEVALDILFDLVDNYNVDLPRNVDCDLDFVNRLYRDDSPGFVVDEMKSKIRDFAQYCFDAYALDFVASDVDEDNDVDEVDEDNDVDEVNEVDDNDFSQVIVCASQFISQVTA